MGTKEQLLRLLEDNRERHVSGAAMAKAIGVSRNAVWKAVKALRAEGYAIDAVTNRGYALSQENDLLSPQGIERFLPDNRAFAVTVRKRVDSTNAEARRRALEGAAEGTVVVAEEQIAGKGRPGKTFFSPAATGLYLSIVLRPTLAADRGQFITCAAAVACAQAIEQVTGAESLIKWVNDIYCDGRKVAGILTEGVVDMVPCSAIIRARSDASWLRPSSHASGTSTDAWRIRRCTTNTAAVASCWGSRWSCVRELRAYEPAPSISRPTSSWSSSCPTNPVASSPTAR